MPYRDKTFVAFDGESDIRHYRLMCAWKQSDRTPFNFFDAHDLNYAPDNSQEASIRAQLNERLRNSSIFVLLLGRRTRYRHNVLGEIEQALDRELPIVGVNLNGLRAMDEENCPPVLRDKLAVHVSFNASILQYALENWPDSVARLKNEGKTGPFYYEDRVYQGLGLCQLSVLGW